MVAPANYASEVRDAMSLPKRILLHDVTLRDGEQTPGVVLGWRIRCASPKMLDDLGVARIEAGMPASGAEDADAIREIVGLGLRARILRSPERPRGCGARNRVWSTRLDHRGPTGVAAAEVSVSASHRGRNHQQ